MKVNEWFLDGNYRLELPFGVVESDPCTNSGANQGLWAEKLAYPSIFLTDTRVRWEPIDETHAGLYVPYGDGEQYFIMQFDPQSGELIRYETNRCHDADGGTLRWWGDVTSVKSRNGGRPNKMINAEWEDESAPWLYFEVEETAFNADLTSYIHQVGP